jgi:hypothetical protein
MICKEIYPYGVVVLENVVVATMLNPNGNAIKE